MPDTAASLVEDIRRCRICADRFAKTKTRHTPRPVPWFRPGARILIAGQAPGARVHEIGEPFRDRSGDRLRDWLGISESVFYDQSRVAVIPMAFCFPGYNAAGSDLPPPKVCANTWRRGVMAHLGDLRLKLLIGGYAQKWHLADQAKDGVTATVAAWRDLPAGTYALPHPSWRNTGWLKKNPWFEKDLLPKLRHDVKAALA